jgi:hypothetical protein
MVLLLTLPRQDPPALPARLVPRTCRAPTRRSQAGRQSRGPAQTAPSRRTRAGGRADLLAGVSGESLAAIAHLPCVGGQQKLKLVVPPAAVWVPGITTWPSICAWNVLPIDQVRCDIYVEKLRSGAEVRRVYKSGQVEVEGLLDGCRAGFALSLSLGRLQNMFSRLRESSCFSANYILILPSP